MEDQCLFRSIKNNLPSSSESLEPETLKPGPPRRLRRAPISCTGLQFLRQAWECVVSEGDDAWIDLEVASSKQHPGQSFAGIGHALAKMQAKGVAREDMVDLVRGMQARLLFDFCYLLADPSLMESSVEDLGWALVETDEDFEPTGEVIASLHESVLDMDPTGREMRPRNAL